MEHLFAYGILKDEEKMKKVLGRVPEGVPDRLFGFECKDETVLVDGVFYCGITPQSEGVVEGMLYSVYPEELSLIDAEETDAFKREKMQLESGDEAYVYVPIKQR